MQEQKEGAFIVAIVRDTKIRFILLVTMVFSLIIFQFAPTAMAYDNTELKGEFNYDNIEKKGEAIIERKGKIIAESVYYNVMTQKYEFDSEQALIDGLTKQETLNAETFFESMSVADVEEMNKVIGFDESEYKQEGDVEAYFIPLVLIPIVKFLGGAAGAVIVFHVVTYGIAKACQNLKGKYWFFTDFCKTNKWI